MTVAAERCSQKEMQVVAGGLVYIATFRRALMGCLNSIWSFIEEFNRYPVVIRLEIPSTVCLEICRFLALVPLARLDFRASPNELVTASDASTQGGGVTVSRGLSNLGQMAAVCPVRGDVAALEEMTQVLTVGLFDGIGALRVAADAAGLPVAGHVSVEVNPRASRVLESRFPGTLFVDDVEKVDQEMVKQWACQYTRGWWSWARVRRVRVLAPSTRTGKAHLRTIGTGSLPMCLGLGDYCNKRFPGLKCNFSLSRCSPWIHLIEQLWVNPLGARHGQLMLKE